MAMQLIKPEAVRLYTAAAVDFQRVQPKDTSDEEIDSEEESESAIALSTFQTFPTPSASQIEAYRQSAARLNMILALPADENGSRAVWAAFMLGRIAAIENKSSEAIKFFALTRDLSRKGIADPLGLGVASLGEEARLHLHPGGLAQAVALYIEQLRYGSSEANYSLRRVAYVLMHNDSFLEEALANSQVQHLLFMYMYCQDSTNPFYGLGEVNMQNQPSAALNSTRDVNAPKKLELWGKIADIVKRNGLKQLDGLDWLAAEAYNRGQFGLANRLITLAQKTPLSYWIIG